ncbi:DUF4199 family protein [Fulvivirgaceae bacterium PWU4]|uniref:DUF4199 family protein n=1 Tax=Chryseosolibacter histidini TaxID=2782349 RepID=A0AAP2GRG1_9BACT|nr:DUF4199 domain-containing protein [Chryseosolibacter histidini]MBT1699955.1 DUF4199 family protein [Chryseosolibacter histidini]
MKNLNLWNRPDRIPEIYGTLIALGLIVYFFVMYALGLVHIIELRLLNLFIMLGGIYSAMKQYKRTHAGHLNYFRGLSIGVATSVIGASTFAAFLLLYLKADQNLMASIIEREPMGRFLNEYIAAAAVTLEGTFSGMTITYLLLNYVETDKATM